MTKISRRHLVGGGVATALLGIGAFELLRPCGWPRFDDGQPRLRMPFPAGTVVLCEQGNDTQGTHSNKYPQNTFALDFSNGAAEEVRVTAVAPGTVSFALAGVNQDDPSAGAEYGNHVRVDHGSFISFFAHLDAVAVIAGQHVDAGDPIGTMGHSGLAASRHLHFSLHKGKPKQGAGAPRESVPIHGILCCDVTEDAGPRFQWLDGGGFVADYGIPWRGHLYGSESSRDRAPTDKARDDLRDRLHSARAALTRVLAARTVLADVARRWKDSGASAGIDGYSRDIDPILHDDPDNPVGNFYRAAAVLLPSNDLAQAKDVLERVMRQALVPRRFESWLVPYATANLGIVAVKEGHPADARRLFDDALTAMPTDDLRRLVGPYLAELRR